ncbi:MAG: DUF2292 domain-containing protein [Dehalobacterium sp.]
MKDKDLRLTKKETNLINLIRETGCGEVKIIMMDKQPIRVVRIKKNIKL